MGLLMLGGLLYVLSNTTDIITGSACFFYLLRGKGLAWHLFHQLNTASTQAAGWGALRSILNQRVPRRPISKVAESGGISCTSKMNSYSLCNVQANEYRITGSSGSGKSTWMVQELIRLSQSWSETRWIYLQQNLTIPRSSNMTILDFFNGGLSRTELVTAQEVCQWAKRLQLEKIINVRTIYCPFKKPSGEQ